MYAVADLGGGAQPARAPPFETFFYKCPPPFLYMWPPLLKPKKKKKKKKKKKVVWFRPAIPRLLLTPPDVDGAPEKKKKKLSDSARLYPGCYLPPWRRWRSGKKSVGVPPPPPRLSAFLGLARVSRLAAVRKNRCYAPLSQIPGSAGVYVCVCVCVRGRGGCSMTCVCILPNKIMTKTRILLHSECDMNNKNVLITLL